MWFLSMDFKGCWATWSDSWWVYVRLLYVVKAVTFSQSDFSLTRFLTAYNISWQYDWHEISYIGDDWAEFVSIIWLDKIM